VSAKEISLTSGKMERMRMGSRDIFWKAKCSGIHLG